MKVYNKLVRDKIPEIIAQDGKKAVIEILSDDRYLKELEKKLGEEVNEYLEDKSIEEMADILEVLQAICIARRYTLEELELVRKRKAESRGGFKNKIFLSYVDNRSGE